jgi:N-acetylneuraminic acid mutarotase
MGKKKSKKADPEKQAALAARKEAKAEKSARKRLQKVMMAQQGVASGDEEESDSSSNDGLGNENDDDDDMDRLLNLYKQRDDAAENAHTCQLVSIPDNDGFPWARANATLTVAPDHGAAYLFGGEYYDGIVNVASDQLFRLDLTKRTWKQIVGGRSGLSRPLPRCAHSAAFHNRNLYILGGEIATTDGEYRHYKDVWKFDTKKLEWTEIKAVGNGTMPSARSGHCVAIWKHFMIVFGGFYEASRSSGGDRTARWYNDVMVLDLQTETWRLLPYSKFQVQPEPRSACNAAIIDGDRWLIHGGFSKSPTNTSETKVHTDAWVLHLRPILEDKPPKWERWTSSLPPRILNIATKVSEELPLAGMTANGRLGTRAASYDRKNIVVFGGVVDRELPHHQIDSVFYNDLWIFHVEKRKFIPVRIHRNNNSNNNKKKPDTILATAKEERVEDAVVLEDEYEDYSSEKVENQQQVQGWDLEKLRSDMFAFRDGSGNVVYENQVLKQRSSRIVCDDEDEEKEEEKEESKNDREHNPISSSTMSKRFGSLTPDIIIDRTEPLPRINSCIFVHGNVLYIFGGLLEVGDREVTLDDMWCIDLKKKRMWERIFPGTMHEQVWRGVIHDDDDSYYSAGTENKTGDVENLPSESESEDEEKEESKEEVVQVKTQNPKKEIADLVQTYGLQEENCTPHPRESLDDFYSRTSHYWNNKASQQETTLQSCDMDVGFLLARDRFETLQPIIGRILELQALHRKQKEERKKDEKKGASKTSPE